MHAMKRVLHISTEKAIPLNPLCLNYEAMNEWRVSDVFGLKITLIYNVIILSVLALMVIMHPHGTHEDVFT